MRVAWRVCLTATAIAGTSFAARAQTIPDSTRRDTSRARLESVVVRGIAAPATVGGASAVVVAVDSLRIAPSALFDQVVARLPFIHVRENSRGEAEISMRGSESRQVAVFVDGVPITLAWDHRADIWAWSLARNAGRALFASIRVSAMIDNVADTLIYSQCALPEPGRTLRLGVEIG